MTEKGIKDAGHTEIQPLLCHVAETVAVMSVVSCYWHDTTREAITLPLSYFCFTHCVFTIRFLSEYSGGNFAPADLIIITV